MSSTPPYVPHVPVPSQPHHATAPEVLQVLLNASALLFSQTDLATVFSSILNLAAQTIPADAYAIWRTADSGGSWNAVSSRGLSPAYRKSIPNAPDNLPTFRVIPDVSVEPTLKPYVELYASEGIRSLLVVPLVVDHATAGTLVFYWRSPRDFRPTDISYASALANFASAAIHATELHEENRREKGRLAFLCEASSILASSLDYELTLQSVAYLAVPHIADWCTVHILENGAHTHLVVAHADSAWRARAEAYYARYPEDLDREHGLGGVLRTGQTEVVSHVTPEMLAAVATDEDHLNAMLEIGTTSSILVALAVRGRILGAIRLLSSGSDRHFTSDDVLLAEDLARRAAVAIENAQLHRALLDRQ